MSRRTVVVVLVVLTLVAVAAVVYALTRPDTPRVTLGSTADSGETSPAAGDAPLRIAVSAMISPKETFDYYTQILDYVGKKTGRPVELVQRETYQEVNELVRKGELDMAFVCTGAYIEGHNDFGMELLCAPMAYGAPLYHSYIIVSAESTAKSLEDLRGKSFAFTDPLSNTGRLVPVYMLGQMGEKPSTFFAKTSYTYSHDISIEAVADGLIEGAAVDSLVYDYLAAKDATVTAATRILEKSPPHGIPPVVVPKGLDPALKSELGTVLLGMHEDPQGAAILRNVMIDRFVTVEDSSYDSVRQMQDWLAEHGQ